MRKFPVDEVWVQVTKPHPPVAVRPGQRGRRRRARPGRPRGLSPGRARGARPARVFLGLGSNLGDRDEMLRQARRAAGGAARAPPSSAASSLYVTAPVGGPEQDDYLNQVVEMRTALSPRELLVGDQAGSKRRWAGNVW